MKTTRKVTVHITNFYLQNSKTTQNNSYEFMSFKIFPVLRRSSPMRVSQAVTGTFKPLAISDGSEDGRCLRESFVKQLGTRKYLKGPQVERRFWRVELEAKQSDGHLLQGRSLKGAGLCLAHIVCFRSPSVRPLSGIPGLFPASPVTVDQNFSEHAVMTYRLRIKK